MSKTETRTDPRRDAARRVLDDLEALRADVRARKSDLTAEQAEELADRIVREAVDELAASGKVSFERDHAAR